jgi:hypothetical protein
LALEGFAVSMAAVGTKLGSMDRFIPGEFAEDELWPSSSPGKENNSAESEEEVVADNDARVEPGKGFINMPGPSSRGARKI